MKENLKFLAAVLLAAVAMLLLGRAIVYVTAIFDPPVTAGILLAVLWTCVGALVWALLRLSVEEERRARLLEFKRRLR